MEMKHAIFAPSSMERHVQCTGSFGLSMQIYRPPDAPEESSIYADEGTRLHEVAAQRLGRKASEAPVLAPADYVALKPYLQYATTRMHKADMWAVEQRLGSGPLLSGTVDLMMFFKREALLEIVDLKNGAGILVDAERNPQLSTYAFLALTDPSLEPLMRHVKNVRLTIVQPPNEDKPISHWDLSVEDVMFWGTVVHDAIKTALAGAGRLKPGKWCRFCPARGICPALRGELNEGLQALPLAMTTTELAAWLDRADRLEQFIAGVRAVGHKVATEAALQGGVGIPGWGLKPKRAMRQWTDEDKVLKIARRRKIKIWQDKLMSPAMAEEAHPNLPKELSDLITAVSSGSNLVRLTEAQAAAQALAVKKPDGATKMERVMANLAMAKLRR